MNSLVKLLVTVASSASIGFGLWHFFVPRIWNWYSYMDTRVTELIIAVRAVNFFFSLSLVLFGVLNLLFTFGGRANRFSTIVLLAATSILWLSRVVLQAIYPQGSISRVLQFGMLATFLLISLCYTVSVCILITQSTIV